MSNTSPDSNFASNRPLTKESDSAKGSKGKKAVQGCCGCGCLSVLLLVLFVALFAEVKPEVDEPKQETPREEIPAPPAEAFSNTSPAQAKEPAAANESTPKLIREDALFKEGIFLNPDAAKQIEESYEIEKVQQLSWHGKIWGGRFTIDVLIAGNPSRQKLERIAHAVALRCIKKTLPPADNWKGLDLIRNYDPDKEQYDCYIGGATIFLRSDEFPADASTFGRAEFGPGGRNAYDGKRDTRALRFLDLSDVKPITDEEFLRLQGEEAQRALREEEKQIILPKIKAACNQLEKRLEGLTIESVRLGILSEGFTAECAIDYTGNQLQKELPELVRTIRAAASPHRIDEINFQLGGNDNFLLLRYTAESGEIFHLKNGRAQTFAKCPE
ncbi:MAG: hypothetical protein ACI4X9_03835 [Kiritimatiellia bacterium]